MFSNPAVRVGILVFIAFIAFTAVAVFLTGYRTRMSGYPVLVTFSDAMGIQRGSEVRMSGVTIGVVDKIGLTADQRAEMRLLINRQYDIPIGSRFALRVGIMMGDKYIDIIPKRGVRKCYVGDSRVKGEVPQSLEDLVPKAQKVLDSLEKTSDNINRTFGTADFSDRLDKTLASVQSATARLDRTMAVVEGTAVSQQSQIRAIISNVAASSQSLRALTSELNRVAKGTDFQGMEQEVKDTLVAAKKASESLQRSAESLESLVTAPELQTDVRQTVKGARQAVEGAQVVIDKVNNVFGGKGGRTGPKINFREPTVEAVVNPENHRLRMNAYATLPMKGDRFLRVGIYDLGGSSRGILQSGTAINKNTDLRFGIYASKLSAGIDHSFGNKWSLTANWYDPERSWLDVQAGYQVTDQWDVLFGVDRLLSDNQLTFGARFTK